VIEEHQNISVNAFKCHFLLHQITNTHLYSFQNTRDVRIYARKERRQGGQGFGKATPSDDDNKEPFFDKEEQQQGTRPDPPKRDLESLAANTFTSDSSYRKQPENTITPSTSLPAVTRDQIISTCLQTSALIAIMGIGLDQLAPLLSITAWQDNSEAVAGLLKCTVSSIIIFFFSLALVLVLACFLILLSV
jgi:hypothetical protein